MRRIPTNPQHIEHILAEYHQQVEWLLSLVSDPSGSRYFIYKDPEQRQVEFAEQFARTVDLLDHSGKPQQCFKAVHVAGTSGKGSLVVMLASMLTACGMRTGHHTSPYLQIVNEKLVVDQRMISPSQFSQLVAELQTQYQQWQQNKKSPGNLKYIEAWAALTFLWMARQKVDWAVIETGLGGRYDPTNVLQSKLAVVSNVNLDHTEVLGGSLADIARHKAGIIKPGGLAITGETKNEALSQLQLEADAQGVRLYKAGIDFSYSIERIDSGGALINVLGPYHNYQQLKINLPGEFQTNNAALAVAGLDLLREFHHLPITEEAVRAGLAAAFIPGRMEVVQKHPLVLLDGAHNQHKMHSLVSSLQQQYPQRKFTVILGVLATKDAGGMIEALAPLAERWIATQPKVFGKPSLPVEELTRLIKERAAGAQVKMASHAEQGLTLALEGWREDELVLVTGSIYLVGEARERWYPSMEMLRQLEQGGEGKPQG